MMFRRLFALGTTAALGHAPLLAWCAPKARREKVREGVDDQGRLRFQPEHHQIFGSGFHHDVFWKCKIVQMYKNCE